MECVGRGCDDPDLIRGKPPLGAPCGVLSVISVTRVSGAEIHNLEWFSRAVNCDCTAGKTKISLKIKLTFGRWSSWTLNAALQ